MARIDPDELASIPGVLGKLSWRKVAADHATVLGATTARSIASISLGR